MSHEVCIGCGLDVDDDNILQVATSGGFGDILETTWTDGDLDAPGAITTQPIACTDSTLGSVVYCDKYEQLRMGPDRFTISAAGIEDDQEYLRGLSPNLAAFTEDKGVLITSPAVTLTNPSPCRTMIAWAQPLLEIQYGLFPGDVRGTARYNFQRQIRTNGGTWTNSTNGAVQLRTFGDKRFVILTKALHLHRHLAPFIIEPGGTYTLQVRGLIRSNGEGGAGAANDNQGQVGALRAGVNMMGWNI